MTGIYKTVKITLFKLQIRSICRKKEFVTVLWGQKELQKRQLFKNVLISKKKCSKKF